MLLFQNLPTGTFVDIVVHMGEELHLASQVPFWGFNSVLTHFKPEMKNQFFQLLVEICN